MKIDITTLFPEMCKSVLLESITGRAIKNGLVDVNFHDIRDFTTDKHRRVDDKPYGGGTGMVMQAQPVYDCVMEILKTRTADEKSRIIYLSPQGKKLNQSMVTNLSKADSLILICGHYEGLDQRVLDELSAEEISVGDYVLTGGELPAMILADAVIRLLPDVLPNEDAFTNESHFDGLLEYPQYTRPEVWRGREVPAVLLTGHHINISKWQAEQALAITKAKRPDLLNNYLEKRQAMKKIGIIGAMPSELKVFREKLKNSEKHEVAGFDFFETTLHNCTVIHVCCGIGKVNAAMCTQLLITHFGVGCIINTGVAGGIADETKVLDIVISKDAVHHDLNMDFLKNYPPHVVDFSADKNLIAIAKTICENLGERVFVERIVSGEIFVSDTEIKNKIIEKFNPYAVDMETAAIAHVAKRNDISYVSVRCISDKADEEGDMSFDEFSAIAAVKVANIVLKMIKKLGEQD